MAHITPSGAMATISHRIKTPYLSRVSFNPSSQLPTRVFSSTASQCKPRRGARNNPRRGMSAIRGTGIPPWIRLSVSKNDLKVPLVKPKPEGIPDHGLWGFFNTKKTIFAKPEEEREHGRAWTAEELRRHSFQDLHTLWWACLRERNRLNSEYWTRYYNKAGFGDYEAGIRLGQVKKTMKAVKFTLTERWYAWEDARKLAEVDPEVLVENGQIVYKPSDEPFEDEEEGGTFMEEKFVSERLPTAEVLEAPDSKPAVAVAR